MKYFTPLLFCLTISIFHTSNLFGQLNNPKNLEFTWKTDTNKTIVDLSELNIVLPPRSFTVLDYPDFIGNSEGMKTFLRNEPVLAISIGNQAKAYPLNMLTIHEIANDTFGSIPIVATYCPLCNSGLVFERTLEFDDKETVLEFEVSGLLRNSDMVMMDRTTESWWQQLMGQAIVGEMAGSNLKIVPSLIISVEEFFKRYPNGQILSKNTGNEKIMARYGKNYYENYDSIGNKPWSKFFEADKLDQRLPAMERIVNIHSGPHFKVYPFSAVEKKGVVNDTFKNKHVVLFHKKGTISVLDSKDLKGSKDIGSVTVFEPVVNGRKLTFYKNGNRFFDHETGSVWDITGRCTEGELKGTQLTIESHSNHFAFAWLAFYPDTEIYQE